MNTTIVGYCVLEEIYKNGEWVWSPLDNIIASNKYAIQTYIEGFSEVVANRMRVGTIIVGD